MRLEGRPSKAGLARHCGVWQLQVGHAGGRKVGRVESSLEIVPPPRPNRTPCNRRPTVRFRSRQ